MQVGSSTHPGRYLRLVHTPTQCWLLEDTATPTPRRHTARVNQREENTMNTTTRQRQFKARPLTHVNGEGKVIHTVPYSTSVPAHKKAKYALVDGDPDTVRAWSGELRMWKCANPNHDPFPCQPRRMCTPDDAEHCPNCHSPRLTETHPQLAKQLVGDPNRVTAKTHSVGHTWMCPQCDTHIYMSIRALTKHDTDPVENLLAACPNCSTNLTAKYPTIAAALIRTGDGETNPSRVIFRETPTTQIRNKRTLFECPDCGKHSTKSIYAAIQTYEQTGRPPYCRKCHWKRITNP